MDPNTYGKGACFEVLAEILEEHPDHARKAGAAVHDAYYKVGCVGDIEVASVQREALVLLHKEAKRVILASGWPEVVRSHTACCVTAIYRRRIRALTDEMREFIAEQRQRPSIANIPVVLVTGMTRGTPSGVRVLLKPYGVDELLAALRAVVGGSDPQVPTAA